ncbi:hypothetical protein VNO80_35516 [Phaseolus coccineus]|uniref:Uncharacterized protein n=1 Tax=Phaseolus coccineus TaxID=3886 RepID=A0AAN9KR28_PHACN
MPSLLSLYPRLDWGEFSERGEDSVAVKRINSISSRARSSMSRLRRVRLSHLSTLLIPALKAATYSIAHKLSRALIEVPSVNRKEEIPPPISGRVFHQAFRYHNCPIDKQDSGDTGRADNFEGLASVCNSLSRSIRANSISRSFDGHKEIVLVATAKPIEQGLALQLVHKQGK